MRIAKNLKMDFLSSQIIFITFWSNVGFKQVIKFEQESDMFYYVVDSFFVLIGYAINLNSNKSDNVFLTFFGFFVYKNYYYY